MTNRVAGPRPIVLARIAGLLYLVPLAPFGLLYVPTLVVPDDAEATAARILASESTVRLSMASALLSQVGFVFVVLALWRLFRPVDKTMAFLMVVFLLLGVPIAMIDELNHLAVLWLLRGADHAAAFSTSQLHSLAFLFLDLRQYGLAIAGIFWGLWLFPMGYLVFRADFLPRLVKKSGLLLMTIGCFGYVIDGLATFVLPERKWSLVFYTGWVELVLPLWLVVRGVDVERWKVIDLTSPR
jgi:hypothetical protein